MSNNKRVDILTPVARLVRGSLYNGNDKDAEGRPLVVKNGPDAGKPRLDYFFAVAIPKGPERHWAETEWGAKIWQVGHTAFPNGQAQRPDFAWKVTDGDSQIPNKKGKKPCDQEGYRGHWVIGFSSGFAPRIFNADGSQQLLEADFVKLGYYVQVFGSVAGNGSDSQPGVYLNHSMVAFAAYGPEISVGPDASAVGFGGAPLPAGASAAPVGGAFNPAPVPAPAVPGIPAPAVAAPAVPSPAPAVPAMMPPAAPAPTPAAAPAAAMPSPGSVTPHPGFVAPPPAAPAAPAAPARVMLPAANGIPYEAYIANGWTDEVLRANGYMA